MPARSTPQCRSAPHAYIPACQFGIYIGSTSAPVIDHVTVTQIGDGVSKGIGIVLQGSQCPTLSNDTISHAAQLGMFWGTVSVSATCAPTANNPSNLTLTDNGTNNWIDIAAAALVTADLPNAGPDWLVGDQDLTVQNLTIEPNVVLHVADGKGITVPSGASLTADGTNGPITFTSAHTGTTSDPTAAGQWAGIDIDSGSATLKHATLEFAGSATSNGRFGIRVAGTHSDDPITGNPLPAPDIDNVTVNQIGDGISQGVGVWLLGAPQPDSNCPTLAHLTISHATRVGLLWQGDCAPSATNPSAVTLSNDGTNNWIQIDAAPLTGISTQVLTELPNAGPDWFLDQSLTLANGLSTLKIDPTVVLHVADGAGIFVDNGTLSADGTNGAITFTSVHTGTSSDPTSPGQWGGIDFRGGSGTVSCVTVQFAGANTVDGHGGIQVTAGGPFDWSFVTTRSNLDNGLVLTAPTSISLQKSNFENSPSGLGISNSNASGSIDASLSYWNSASGPGALDNPGGTGDSVLGSGATNISGFVGEAVPCGAVRPAAPTITSLNHAYFIQNEQNSFSVITTGTDVQLSESGTLPSDVTFTPNADGSGTLSGNPSDQAAKTFDIVFTATDKTGQTAVQPFTLTVGEPLGCTVDCGFGGGGGSMSATPEADSIVLFGIGLAGLAGYARTRLRARFRR